MLPEGPLWSDVPLLCFSFLSVPWETHPPACSDPDSGNQRLLCAVDVPPTIKVLVGATVISDLHGGGSASKLTHVAVDRLGSLLADGRTHLFLATAVPATWLFASLKWEL